MSSNNKLATFELAEFNRSPEHNNTISPKDEKNKEKPKEDFTGFNHTDFVSWAKSSTEKEYKPFNQPQITAAKHAQQRPDNEWFDYNAFITLAKSRVVVQD
jgi:hypothetical protein